VKLANKIDIALPVGTELHDYTITRVLSLGGFSFVYLAQDKQTVKTKPPTNMA
jgi:serine/threonine protein kinase